MILISLYSRFPGDADTNLAYIKQEFLLTKDMTAINQLAEKFYSISEDQSDKFIVQIGNLLEEAEMATEAIDLYEKWFEKRFDHSEVSWRLLRARFLRLIFRGYFDLMRLLDNFLSIQGHSSLGIGRT